MIRIEDLKTLHLGDELQISGTLYCVNREMPYLAHRLKATIVSSWVEDEDDDDDETESWIGLETGVEDLDNLELYISLEPDHIQPLVTVLHSYSEESA